MSHKLLFLIPDGMGDWGVPDLDGKTPLEAAPTPNMDRLAATGQVGTCRTVPEGMPPGSDIANMSLVGFAPATYHTGRGPIEAAAQGLKLSPQDLVWRLNLVTVTGLTDADNMLDYSSGHIDTPVSAPLVEELDRKLGSGANNGKGSGFTFYPGIQYRHILVQHGAASAPEATLPVNPPHDILDKPIAADLAAYAQYPALHKLVMDAAEILAQSSNGSKANSIWPWGQGAPLILPDFKETYGLDGAVISAVDLVKGLGHASGMEVIDIPGATGLLDTNYQGKVDSALKFLDKGNYVYLHVEAPDECGHSGIVADKVEAIRRFDELIVGPVVEALQGTQTTICIAPDHYTPLEIRTHSSEPVPFLVSHLHAPAASGPAAFTEAIANAQPTSIENGHELLAYVLKEMQA